MLDTFTVTTWSLREGWAEEQFPIDQKLKHPGSWIGSGGNKRLPDGREFWGAALLDAATLFSIYVAYEQAFQQGGWNVLVEIDDGHGSTEILLPEIAPDLLEFMAKFASAIVTEEAVSHNRHLREFGMAPEKY